MNPWRRCAAAAGRLDGAGPQCREHGGEADYGLLVGATLGGCSAFTGLPPWPIGCSRADRIRRPGSAAAMP
ncbi:MAG: hypothetical protein FJ077_04500 [Cyanobacteria bacterium K_DeepCast_35m_m2_023]|nr:hypothetical protein [Cyanobacteria bacterium K_DeepCast_35m_m2_023]